MQSVGIGGVYGKRVRALGQSTQRCREVGLRIGSGSDDLRAILQYHYLRGRIAHAGKVDSCWHAGGAGTATRTTSSAATTSASASACRAAYLSSNEHVTGTGDVDSSVHYRSHHECTCQCSKNNINGWLMIGHCERIAHCE